MTPELIAKINELSKKKREVGLTPEEQKLQEELRQEYIKQFRANFKKQLSNVDVEYPNGKVVPLTDFKKNIK